MPLLTNGNSAKLYCLNWIERRVKDQDGKASILDLGCGTAQNFARLMELHPQVKYVGIEPGAGACEAARRNLEGHDATIINAYAYDVYGRLVQDQFDMVVSFSALEHLFRRQKYLDSAAACLKPGGDFLINYDSGHFVMPDSFKERVKNRVGPAMARIGVERFYQSFVMESDFHAMLEAAGLTVVEAKSFNTRLKGIHKIIPEAYREEYMARWLAYEEWLNELGIAYRDDLAKVWTTRISTAPQKVTSLPGRSCKESSDDQNVQQTQSQWTKTKGTLV